MSPANPALTAGRQHLAKVPGEPDPAEVQTAPPAGDPPAGTAPDGQAEPPPGQGHADGDRGLSEMWPVRIERHEPEIPLNVNVPWGVRHGARLLALRKGIDQKALVAEALRAYFAASDFTPPSFWDHA